MDTDVGAGHAARVFENHETVSNWHAAAELASFSFYEASNGTERWAGGFAGDGSLVEVISLLDGDEVSVQSSCPAPGLPRHTRRRVAVHDLLWSHVLGGDGDLDLPYSVTIEADDRAVSVDGEVHEVPGMRIAGDRQWVGTLRLGDVTVKITTASSAALGLRICSDPQSLPALPPEPH